MTRPTRAWKRHVESGTRSTPRSRNSSWSLSPPADEGEQNVITSHEVVRKRS